MIRNLFDQGNRKHNVALAMSLAVCATPVAGYAQQQAQDPTAERMAKLEAMVEKLSAELDAQKQAKSAAPAESKSPSATQAPLLPASPSGARLSYGGMIKLDMLATDTPDGEIPDGTNGRLFYLPSAIPVRAASEGTDLDMHAQFSRFWFAVDADVEGHKLKSYIEADLSGSALGNEVATNTYGLTVRHAYVSWDKWLAGQTWTNFQDVEALPDAVDFLGPTEGTVFVRQAQVRYTTTKGNQRWSFALENPETTIASYRTGARVNSDDNSLPDVTARWLTKGSWGHVSIAALLRQLKHETQLASDSEYGFAASASGRWVLTGADDLRFMLSAGRGIGRYVGLGLGSDAMLEAGGSLKAVDGYAGFVSWRHVFSPQWRGNLFYSKAHFGNDQKLTGADVTEGSQSWHANLIYSPVPKLDLGAELIWARRELEGEAEGDLRRLHLHVKYVF